MVHRSRLALAAAFLLSAMASVAVAQPEYFTDGRAVSSLSGSLQRVDGGNGSGVQLSLMAGPRLGLSVGYATSSAERIGLDPFDPEQIDASTFLIGVQYYLERQGLDGAVTVGTSLSVGFIEAQRFRIGLGTDGSSATAMSFAFSFARAFESEEVPFAIVPTAGGALTALLGGGVDSFRPTPSVAAGIGVGMYLAPFAVVSVAPAATATFGEDFTTDLAVTFGLSVAY